MSLKEQRPKVVQRVIPDPGKPFGGINKYDLYSRYSIDDSDFDDLINFLPMGNSIRQVPGPSTTLATLASTAIWISAQYLNGAWFIYCLCQNGHVYQVAASGGAITDVSGATAIGVKADITNWNGTNILLSDPAASKVYSWDGTTFTTALTSVVFDQVEVFNNRLWGGHNNVITWTNSGTFNSLGGDSGSVTVTDAAAVQPIIAMNSFGGLLYVFGTNYIYTIGNTADIGSPAVLTFTITILQTQIGVNSPFSVIELGNELFFSNNYGFWKLSGSSPTQISGPIDGFFQNFTGGSTFSAAYGEVYGMPVIAWHAQFDSEPQARLFCITSQTVSAEEAYSSLGGGTQWFTAQSDTPQSGAITFVTGIPVSGNPTIYATDGTNIFTMFTNTTSQITSKFTSKYWSFGHPIAYKRVYKIGIPNVITAAATTVLSILDANGNVYNTLTQSFQQFVQWINNFGTIVQWQNNALATVNWTASNAANYSVSQYNNETAIVRIFAVKYAVTSSGATVFSICIEYDYSEAGWGS